MPTLEKSSKEFTAGEASLSHPVDVLGRVRWRSQIRANSLERNLETGKAAFHGHAAVFDSRTWIGSREYGFWEEIDPKAFNKTLADGADVRFLINHNPDLLLGRTTAGTLSLSVDERGLVVGADLPPVSYANDLAILLERRDVTQMSFAFEPIGWRTDTAEDGKPLIRLTEVRLYDVSAVTYPAYEQTDAGLRGAAFDVLTRSLGLDTEATAAILKAVAEGTDPTVSVPTGPVESTRKEHLEGPADATLSPIANIEGPDPSDALRLLRFRLFEKTYGV